MAKSIRSKRRQRVLSVRREKHREKEKKKLWEKHLALQAQRTVEMADAEASPAEQVESVDNVQRVAGEEVMDTGRKKLTKSQLREIQKKWSSSRSKKAKAKKLKSRKAHSRW